MKARLSFAATAAFFLLSACGGGGGSSVSPIPPPPPPPPPPPSFTYGSFPLTKSATFQTTTGHIYYTDQSALIGNTIVSDTGVSASPSGVSISYDASSGSYSVSDGSQSTTFSASTRTSSGTTDTYTKQSGSVTNTLDLFNNVRPGGQAGAGINLTYLSFGKWTSTNQQTGDGRVTYLLFGYPTDPADMPKTGSASYNTMVTGTVVTGCYACAGQAFSGTATFTADFGAGSVSTGLDLTNIGSFQGTGSISGNQFSGTFTGNFNQNGTVLQNGVFDGGFFGPAASEMGYTFSLHQHVSDPYAGAAIEPDSWYTGAVVGTSK